MTFVRKHLCLQCKTRKCYFNNIWYHQILRHSRRKAWVGGKVPFFLLPLDIFLWGAFPILASPLHALLRNPPWSPQPAVTCPFCHWWRWHLSKRPPTSLECMYSSAPPARLQAPCRQHPSWLLTPQHLMYCSLGSLPSPHTQLTPMAPQASPQRYVLHRGNPSHFCFSGHQGLLLTPQLFPWTVLPAPFKFYHISREHTLLCLVQFYPRSQKQTSPH